jgi:HPt (histidine-containing phosphotransfer) domain-containing protein
VATIVATYDDEMLRRAAHALAGSAATVGASALAEVAGELDRSGDRTLVAQLAETFARTRSAFERR